MEFIENINKDEYIKFSESHDKSHFLQSYAWGEFCSKAKGQIAKYVAIKDNKNNILATCLILLRKTPLGYSYGYAPRGPVCDYTDKKLLANFTKYMKKYMKKEKIIYIKFDPDIIYQEIDYDANPIPNGKNNYDLFNYLVSLGYEHKGFYKLYDGNQPRYTFRINLKDEFSNIEKKMNKSFLKSVNNSYRFNMEVNTDNSIDVFYNLMLLNSQRDGFNIYSLNYYKTLSDELLKGNNIKYFNLYINPKEIVENLNAELNKEKEELKINTKRKVDIENRIKKIEKEIDIFKNYDEERRCICSLICTYTNNHAWSFYIGNDELGNLTGAVSRVYYEAIKDAHNMGCTFFDLFGVVGDPKTKYKNLAGIYEFKRKFGDQYTEFMGEFDLINNKFLYNILPFLLKIYRKIKKSYE